MHHFLDINFMKNYSIYLLLDIIFRNGSVKRLTREKVDFSEIALLLNKAILDGLIIDSKERLELTENGKVLLDQLAKKYKKTNKEDWIDKDFASQITKIDKNSIFLPRQNELTF